MTSWVIFSGASFWVLIQTTHAHFKNRFCIQIALINPDYLSQHWLYNYLTIKSFVVSEQLTQTIKYYIHNDIYILVYVIWAYFYCIILSVVKVHFIFQHRNPLTGTYEVSFITPAMILMCQLVFILWAVDKVIGTTYSSKCTPVLL